MEKQCLRKPEETSQETLLRATFQQHAPSTIDLEQGWTKISPALKAPRKQIPFPQTSLFFLANAFRQHQDEKRSLRYPRILVAAIALLLVLIGIGVAFPISNWLDGNQTAYAYAQVNQLRQDQGINVTLLKAYASNSGTSLIVKIQLDTGRGNPVARDTTLRYQQEILTISSGTAAFTNLNVNSSCQFYNTSAVHPSADAQTVTLIWHVDKLVILTQNPNHPTPPLPQRTIYGNWTFQFTIPFHHDNSSPDTSTIDATQC